ncbi:MAG: 2,3,4,5-tetrahydropyridine-2,6-dicarboxylate N-succinyltransferase [Ignavibacteriales bacterium]|nr:2,3,4,5-tetrahydropyridine-2,6-dicarboxylate N-succinyltransferase [Ignavibacteriales bacterium]
MILKERIELYYPQDIDKIDRHEAIQTFNEFKFFLNNGDIRAASPSVNEKNKSGWIVHDWVKKGILLGFRLGELADVSINEHFKFFDKSTYPLKKLTLEHQVRIVPGGSSIRDGAYVAPGVVIMPPAYINVGAYVDSDTMIDSHSLVGSCVQIGKHVHVSAAAQLGGMMEPIGELPVIVEDDVFIGGNTGIFEGTIIKQRAVIAAGVILTGSTPVYDLVNETIYRRTKDAPLIIPESAVVVPGSRAIDTPFAKNNHLALSTPIIIKYRDSKSDAATALEESLR